MLPNRRTVLLSRCSRTASSLLNDLQVLWKLSEDTGAQRNDSIGVLHLTDSGTVAQTDGPVGVGKVATFVAASNQFLYRATMQGTVVMPRATDFAVSAWLWNAGSASLEYFWGGGNTGASDAGIRIGKDASNKIVCYFCDGSASRVAIVASEAMPLSTWVHVSLNFDRDGNCEIFYNGVSKGTGAISAQQADINPAISFNIGRTPAGGNNWNGGIGQAMKHSRLLTSDERVTLYASGAGIAYPF